MCLADLHEHFENEITSPQHYAQGSIQPIDYIIANNLDFCAGNVVKYVTRYKYKNGIADLKKAQFYIERLIKDEERNQMQRGRDEAFKQSLHGNKNQNTNFSKEV